MVVKVRLTQFAAATVLLLASSASFAQGELRDTFFKEADAAKAAAEAANAKLLAPRNYERAVDEYRDAEEALQRGRNIETVRSNAGDAATYYKIAAGTEKSPGRGQR